MPRMMAAGPAATSLIAGAGDAGAGAGVFAASALLATIALFALALAFVLALAIAGGSRAWAQDADDDDAPADSAAADSAAADSLQGDGDDDDDDADDDDDGPGGQQDQGGFHPSYDVRYEILKDVRNWNHSVNADYAIGDKVRLRNQSGLKAKDEETLNHSVETRTTTSSAEYLFSETKSVGVRYTRNWNLDNKLNQATAIETETKTTNSDVGGFARLEQSFGDELKLTTNFSAGRRDNEYAQFNEEGSQGEAEVAINFAPIKTLRSDVTWNGSRSSSTTLTNATAEDTTTTEAKNVDQIRDVRGSVNFTPNETFNVRMNVLDAHGQYQYPDDADPTKTETRTEDRSGFDFATSYKPSSQLSFGLDASRNSADKVYVVDSIRVNRQTKEDIRAAVNYQGWRGGRTSVVLDRDRGYEQFPNQRSQEKSVQHGAVTLSHDQRITNRLTTVVSGRVDLISYIFFRGNTPEEVPRGDRDLLAQSLEWKGDYVVTDRFSTRFGLGVKEDRTVNIEASQAGENNTKQSWWLRPEVQVRPLASLLLRQVYEVRNDYTFFDDEEKQNFLSRKAQVDSKVTYQILKGVSLDITHFFRVTDDGSYDRDVETFRRSSQRSKQSLDLSTGYSPVAGIRFGFGERLDVERAYDFKDVDGRIKKVKRAGTAGDAERRELWLEGSVTRDVTTSLKVEARARRTFASGDRVSPRDKDFYRVETAVRYAL